MPSNLTFNQTKKFRDYILSRNILPENGPQKFTEDNYELKSLNIFSVKDSGGVTVNRTNEIKNFQKNNKYKPTEYDIIENINTYPQTANLKLYPYFTPESHTLIGILTSNKFENESNLFKFSAQYIKNDPNGPISARIAQNLNANINGKNRLLDVSNNNFSTITNILKGKEPLIEKNNRITVSSGLLGKGYDFVKTISGVELPFSEIPGNYLTDPREQTNYTNPNTNQVNEILKDTTNAIGSFLGLQKRNKLSNNPSDIMVEHLGDGQKSNLFNLLSYSKYAPNYTTKARSKTNSQLLNSVNNFAQSAKSLLGLEAPDTISYIGDDRNDNVKYAMSDFNDNIVRSNYYLSLMFDPVQTKLLSNSRNYTERGNITGNLTWSSKQSKNILGANNSEYTTSEQSALIESLSTKYGFRSDSILGKTQELLNSLPTDGGSARSHVANAIDQTSRIFKDGEKTISRGSAIKYVDKFNEEKGVEYCRVWTKDRPYTNYSDTMKKTGTIRKIDSSVLSKPWNLNIAPMSNGKSDIGDSTNIVKRNDNDPNSFYAKKYMFSIENLAWASSSEPGFTYNDLPFCERGSNGGRVMWFPPYNLKFSETSSATWDEVPFLGRPEPIYVYQNSKRDGSISFKIIVDHPSIINLLVKEHFKNMTNDDEIENYINAFFAGCTDLDFYDLITKYSTLSPDENQAILDYLNKSNKTTTLNNAVVKENESIITTTNPALTSTNISSENINFNINLKFDNSIPKSTNANKITSGEHYENLFSSYILKKETYKSGLRTDLTNLVNSNNKKEKSYIFNNINDATIGNIDKQVDMLSTYFDNLATNYTDYVEKLATLRQNLIDNKVDNIKISISSSTSSIGDEKDNGELSLRRAFSALLDIFSRISNNNATNNLNIKWPDYDEVITALKTDKSITFNEQKYNIKDLGYENNNGTITINISSYGETDELCKYKDFTNYKKLNYYAPVCFNCRKSDVKIEYIKKQLNPSNPVIPPTSYIDQNIPNNPNVNNTQTEVTRYKPSLEYMKKIVLKVLNESYYFKKLEENSPLVFNSLKEKLSYFHPAFHSMTPEGLNSRLTFLQQCVRPGNTIPIKDKELTKIPRNTTFGTPPICIIRLGDFYHSKIIIRNIQYDYDESIFDLNPEGIGVQPMIANVTLSVSFIGGQGMEKPIEMLQNALSSNFYANTEIYDDRSINTITTINNQSAELFATNFLSGLTQQYEKINTITNTSEIKEGITIGELNNDNTEINYKKVITQFKDNLDKYFTEFSKVYNETNKKYGKLLTNLFFNTDYRTLNDLKIFYNSSLYNTVKLFGTYPIIKNLSVYKRQLLEYYDFYMSQKRYVDILNFDKILNGKDLTYLEIIINKSITNKIHGKLNEIDNISSLQTFEDNTRNSLINVIDKLNFVTKYGHDVKFIDKKYYKVEYSTYNIYNDYSMYSTYLNNNYNVIFSKLDTRLNYDDLTFTDELIKEFILGLLNEYKAELLSEITSNSYFSTDNYKKKFETFFNKYFINYTPEVIKLKQIPILSEISDFKTNITSMTNELTNTNAISDAELLLSDKKSNDNYLNFYKK
jgi:hypothetical protein